MSVKREPIFFAKAHSINVEQELAMEASKSIDGFKNNVS